MTEGTASRDRHRGALLGLACGDAVGTALEFSPRGSFEPISDMIGGGPFGLLPGEWTDDTSMALCIGRSLIEMGDFDARDQMERFCRWHRGGYLSSNGRCFDIGNTVWAALDRYRRTGDPYSGSTDPASAGNGSIIRLAPVAIFFSRDVEAAVHHSIESSRTTHACQEVLDACRLFGWQLTRALDGAAKQDLISAESFPGRHDRDLSPSIHAIVEGGYCTKSEHQIRGTGYVVESLEAALWCFQSTNTYRDAVLAAANLGDDADTTAAVCGQLAGAHYGASAIPPEWRERLAMRDEIEAMADALREASPVS